MFDGLYAVRFVTPLGAGTGVAYMQDGLLRGGDSMMAYLGNYESDDSTLKIDVHVIKHADVPGIESALGINNVRLQLSGAFYNMHNARLTGNSLGAPGVDLSFEIRFLNA